MPASDHPLARLAARMFSRDTPAGAAAPHTRRPTLPPVEQLEQRLYLGGMASSSLADFGVGDDGPVESSLAGPIAAPLEEEIATDEPDRVPPPPEPGPAPSPPLPRAANPSSVAPPPGTAVSLGDPLGSALQQGRVSELTLVVEPEGDGPADQPGPPTSAEDPATSVNHPEALAAAGPAAASGAAASGTPALPVGATGGAANSAGTAEGALAPASLTPAQRAALIEAAQLEASEVGQLLERASRATASNDAIIAVVDRNGRILGVRVEQGVIDAIPDQETLVFAIDGAVAKARTAALFSNGEPEDSLAPLTSRTVRFISQSTITQREVESNPNLDGADQATALASGRRGPGFVAPIGVGGHFPPEVMFTPPVDLFAIEHTNRDSNEHPGLDGIRGAAGDATDADDFLLRTSGTDADGELLGRFNLDPAFVPAGQELYAPESYGDEENSGLLTNAQSRGIATLPGGVPLFRDTNGDGLGDTLVGGIGVFFPGSNGFATHEQGFVAGVGQTEAQRTNAPKVLEAEFIALAAAGGSQGATPWFPDAKVGALGGVAPVAGLDLPFGRLDLVGITLEVIGPGSNSTGIRAVLDRGAAVGPGASSGVNMQLNNAIDPADNTTNLAVGTLRNGKVVPEGFLVTPHASAVDPTLTAERVTQIINQAIAAADQTRAAVRLPLSSRTRMVFAIADSSGEILGLYRMGNATTFSIDVAVAKARNTAYYADAAALQAVDQVVGAGTAFTNRTFRFLAEPRFPSGIDGTPPPAFSILNDGNINPLTAENLGAPDPVGAFGGGVTGVSGSVVGNDAFFPMTNFRDQGDAGVVADGGAAQPLANQNGIVFFPGSTPLYVGGQLVGGFGVSGDGVDQDDVVTFLGAQGFLPDSTIVRADQQIVDGVRLPYQKFLRNPFG